jgi:MFS family permease
VQSFGFNQFRTILFNIPFGLVNILAIILGGWLATRIKSKGIVIALLALPCIIGASILLALSRGPNSKGPLLAAYYLTSFLAGITPLIYSWHVQNTAGDTKRKVVTGILFIGMCAGNIMYVSPLCIPSLPTFPPLSFYPSTFILTHSLQAVLSSTPPKTNPITAPV